MSKDVRIKTASSWQKDYVFSTITLLANTLIPLIIYPYLTRVLLVENLGKYNFAFSIASLFQLAAQLGLPYYGAREIAKVSHNPIELKKTAGELMGLSFVTGLVFMIIYVLAIVFVPQIHAEKTLFINIGLMVFLAPMVLNWLFQGLQEFKYIALRMVVFRTLGVVLMFVFVRDAGDYAIYGLIIAFVMAGHFPFNLAKTKKAIGSLPLSFKFKKHIAPALLTLPVTVVNIVLIQVSSIMLGFLSTDADVAFFSIPAQIIMVISSLLISLSYVMVPTLTKLLISQDKKEYLKTTKSVMNLSWFLVIPICAGLFMISKDVVVLFAGQQYAAAALTMKIAAFRVIAIAISSFVGSQVLLCNGEEKKLCLSLVLGVLVMVALNLILIPRYGHVGAMIGTVAAEYALAAIQIMLAKKYLSIDMFLTKPLLRYVLIVLLFIPICWGIEVLDLSAALTSVYAIGACALVYFGALFALKDKILLEVINKIFKRPKQAEPLN